MSTKKQKEAKSKKQAKIDAAILNLYDRLRVTIKDEKALVLAVARIYGQSILIAYKDKAEAEVKLKK